MGATPQKRKCVRNANLREIDDKQTNKQTKGSVRTYLPVLQFASLSHRKKTLQARASKQKKAIFLFRPFSIQAEEERKPLLLLAR